MGKKIHNGVVQDTVIPVTNYESSTPLVTADASKVFTQTYSTTTATVPAVTYSVYVVTTVATSVAKTNSSPYGFSSGDADKVVTLVGAVPTDLAGIQVEVAANAADILVNRKLINLLIDALQANGLAG